MTTFDQLVSRVKQQLFGFSLSQEAISSLGASMTDSAITFQADGETIEEISRGLVEIGDELILVKKWDEGSSTVTVMGGTAGRGYLGTTAAAHGNGALIISNPAFPRARIKEAINDTIRGLYPDLVVFATTEITRVSVQFEYELPSAVTDVWYVTGETLGPSKVWQPLQNWRYNPSADTTDFPSGKSIQLLDEIVPGRNYRIVYAKPPTVLSADADVFETVSGYPDRIVDLVAYGACKRLLPAMEAARLQLTSVETTERAPLVPPQSAARAASLYASLYAERLQEERNRQFSETPNFATFQGS